MMKGGKQGGFTLIEIVAAAALLGVLLTMLMPSLEGANEKVKNAKLKNDLAAVDQALQLYKLENGTLPEGLTELDGSYLAKGSGIRLQQRKQQLEKAWQAGQLQLFTGKTDDGFIVRENALEQDGLIMKEVQILDDKGKICCNLVQMEK